MLEFLGSIFNTFVGRPVFNLLIIIIALVPGHNLGISIIIFTVIIRLLLYPLLKKQLHHAIAMRKLQPDIKKIKKQTKGDKQKEYAMMQELYKEREIKPMASIGILMAQLPILLALFFAIRKIVENPETVVSNAYSWVQSLPFIKELANSDATLDTVFLGFIDLTQSVMGSGNFWSASTIGAFVIVVGSVIVQYFQSKQLMMTDKNSRSLKQILKDSGKGKEVDQTEVQAATSKMTLYIIPFFLFFVAISLPAALSLYWLVGGIVALIQQTRILKQDVTEMEASVDGQKVEASIVASADKDAKKTDKKTGAKTYVKTEEAEIVSAKKSPKKNKKKKQGKKKSKSKKRR